MIQFLNPAWLWALLGMLVPIAIHLLSRKEGKVIPMGSTRFLSETSTSKFRSIKLNEVALLLLRCLLIALLVFFLAGVTIRSSQREKWILIEPGLEQNNRAIAIRDSLSRAGYQLRSFSPFFPEKADSAQRLSYWSLVTALERSNIEEAVILTNQYAANFKGKRVSLPAHVKWIALPSTGGIHSAKVGGLNVRSDDFVTELDHVSSTVSESDAQQIHIYFDESFSYDKDVLFAVLKSIEQVAGASFDIRVNPDDQHDVADWHFNLGTPPKRIERTFSMDAEGDGDWTKLISLDNKTSTSFVIRRRLTPDGVMNEKFMIELADVLLAEDVSLVDSLPDERIMPDAMLWSKDADPIVSKKAADPATAGSSWIPVLFVVIFCFERYLSRRRNQ